MEKVDFDNYANDYDKILSDDLKVYGEESGYFAEYKIKIVKNKINSYPEKILDFGTGIGRNIKYFKKYFPDSKITGCDISEKSIELARKNNPKSEFFLINEQNIKENFNNFDLIFTSCVFHHIEPSHRRKSIEYIYSMLRNSGVFFIFEHNPLNPVTRKIVKDCVWDADAILLPKKESLTLIEFSGLKVNQFRYTLFFPAFLKMFRFLENFMGFIPLGGQYYLIAVK